MRLICLIAAFLVVLASPAAAQSWSRFFYPEYQVEIQFPAAPAVTQVAYPAGVSSVPATVYDWRQDTSDFKLTIAEFAGRPSDQRAAANQAMSAIRASGEVKLDLDECISGQPGREFSVLGKDGTAVKASVFVVGSRLYLLEARVQPPNVQRDSGDAARFQQSLSFGRNGFQQPVCRGRAGPSSRVSP